MPLEELGKPLEIAVAGEHVELADEIEPAPERAGAMTDSLNFLYSCLPVPWVRGYTLSMAPEVTDETIETIRERRRILAAADARLAGEEARRHGQMSPEERWKELLALLDFVTEGLAGVGQADARARMALEAELERNERLRAWIRLHLG